MRGGSGARRPENYFLFLTHIFRLIRSTFAQRADHAARIDHRKYIGRNVPHDQAVRASVANAKRLNIYLKSVFAGEEWIFLED